MIRFSRGEACVILALSCFSAGFSQTPAPAEKIAWREFVPGSFRKALEENRLVLLVLDVPWNEAARAARRNTWADPAVAGVIEEGFVPVLVAADQRPDLLRRFPAEGWPAVNLLLPNGSPLWFRSEEADAKPRRMTSGFLPGAKMAALLQEALQLYRSNPEGLAKLAREQMAVVADTARPVQGNVDEGIVWGISQQIRPTFDPERQYFGGAPRLPRFDLIEFLLTISAHEEDPWRVFGLAALDTLAAKLIDPADGGLYRAAAGLDWENPEKEKLLDRNARMLDLFTLAFRTTGRKSYREKALKSAGLLTGPFSLPDGSFQNALCASCPGGGDAQVVSASIGQAAGALIRAGAALGETSLIERGLAGARFLKEKRFRQGQGVARVVLAGEGILPVHLEDLADTSGAFLAAYEVTGNGDWLTAARDLGKLAVSNLRDPATHAFRDRIPEKAGPGPLQLSIFPLEHNARMVRSLVRLYFLTDDLLFRDAAHDALKAFGASVFQSPLGMPSYGLAAFEYHFAPLRVAVTGTLTDPRTGALLRAAQGIEHPFVITLHLDPQRDGERIARAGLQGASAPGLNGFYQGLGTPQLTDPAVVRGAMADLVAKVRKKQAEARQASPPPGKKTP